MKATAWAPGNISCIFVIKKTKNPKTSGSLGAGFTIDKGVMVSIKKFHRNNTKTKRNQEKESVIFFNDRKIDFPTVRSVIEELAKKPVTVRIKTTLPLGAGFGVSGASALASAYALDKLFHLERSKRELALIAHIAEVENLTGLGDVTNQYLGGFLAKYESSHKFQAKRFPFQGKSIYYRIFSGLKTKSILANKEKKSRINRIGTQKLKKLRMARSLGDVIDLSYDFAAESGLLMDTRVKKTIEYIRKSSGHASMIMLGNSVFSDVDFPGAKKAKISNKAAR